MRWTEPVDRFQRRHPAAGFPIAVLYKFMDDDGHFLAALVTYYGFLALFPTLLLLATVLGLVLAGDPALQQQLLDSALAAALRSVEDAAADPEALRRTRACLSEFADAVRWARSTTSDDLFVAGDVVQTVQRSLDALPVREPAG